jgi:hypothetical protein
VPQFHSAVTRRKFVEPEAANLVRSVVRLAGRYRSASLRASYRPPTTCPPVAMRLLRVLCRFENDTLVRQRASRPSPPTSRVPAPCPFPMIA